MSTHSLLCGFWPVAQRELRESARRPLLRWLRLLGVTVGAVLLWRIVADSEDSVQETAGNLLGGLHTMLLILIMVVAPGLAADCIAREKRDGTLGLLFLTPLSAGGIVAGKALVQTLRAFTLWLAILPLLTIPFLSGGMTWRDAFSALSIEFCAAVLCLAAGLLASALAKQRGAAFCVAYVLAAAFIVGYSFTFMLLLYALIGGPFRSNPPWWVDAYYLFSGASEYGFGFDGWSRTLASSAFNRSWTLLCSLGTILTLLLFYLTARFAAWRLDRSWQDKIPTIRHQNFLRRYCTPLFQRRFRRSMQRALDHNPIAWLQQYSWKARTMKWLLCLALFLLGCAASAIGCDREAILPALVLVLAGIYTFVGVSGFLEEKRSGALELLLITPLPVNKLILGRVWGLWKQFLPAAFILIWLTVHFTPEQGSPVL